MVPRILLVLVMAAAPAGALAQDEAARMAPATIGVIDSQFILVSSEASQGIRTQIELIRDLYSAEISQLEDGLRTQEQEVTRQRAILAPEAFAERLAAFEGEVDRVQRLVEERNRQIDQAFNQAMSQVRDVLLQVVVELSEARGFNLLLEQNDVLYAVPQLDLTDEVIVRLNELLPNVEVPIPDDG